MKMVFPFYCLQQTRKKRESQDGTGNENEEENEEMSAEERAMLKQICGFCKGGPEKNKYGEDEDLLSCNDCGNSGMLIIIFLSIWTVPLITK